MSENEKQEKSTNDTTTIKEDKDNKEDNMSKLTKTFNKIINHFSEFLSKHSVYEAAPENSKVLVFNSDLSFKEMVKAFINEDIYCALIYNSEKERFIGLITISDILRLFKYIIEQAQKKEITDYFVFIQEIFSSGKNLQTKEEDKTEKKDKNFDILKYLTKINFNDYNSVVKKNKKLYNLIAISLDASLLDVLKMIYQVGVHRLVVEETKKKNNTDNKKKENEINNNNNQNEEKKVENENEQKEKEKEKNEKVNNISEKKLKKVKTKKKVEDNNGIE